MFGAAAVAPQIPAAPVIGITTLACVLPVNNICSDLHESFTASGEGGTIRIYNAAGEYAGYLESSGEYSAFIPAAPPRPPKL